ncbi:MAG: FGGY-family carbohydrate kinase [Actinomyces sp.]|uniref:FGGY-family carbohydrate kinase n=1 Tax=Actinomycetaceae TaxID=2049 RepID=UPI0008A52E21|nr:MULTISPECIES: FGGY-family carbohydrate kinase [Actinomycetaceae]MBS5827217.1 carbohydrate kinase [Actinomyces sp.]MDK7142957.1 FGGY-family carbohydrate kinase [Gleimia europaea]MDP9833967.1 xylulokinase [Gleimia europaea]MDU4832628.1 FGGY-family carbohydrate kinase [Actinomyces sp.]MDU7239880.1 FGGY-family carbohydrate kinase [Actinomyces sp.]
MQEVVIGVDGGTTAVKAVAFDLHGKILATHHEAVPVQYGDNGEAEQDMNQIWEAVATCLREVASEVRDSKIVGIGLTGQGDGAWLIDEAGEPVRPAANWLDGRAAERVKQWDEDGRAAKVLEVTGTTTFGGLFPVLIEELAATQPDVVARATTHLNCKDWIRFKLTGERLTDYTEASRSFLDVRTTDGFSAELAKDLGLEEYARLLPEIHRADGKAVPLSEEAARETGIPAGTPVGVGMIDVAVTGMGLGALENGDSWLILGTTAFVGTLLPSVSERRSDLSMVLATGNGKQVLEFMAPMTGTPNLDWIRKVLGLEENSWTELEKLARMSKPGASGVVYLPYASPGGERAPFLDTNASASWAGMSLTSSTEDILRSVYEGVAFSLVECINTLQIHSDLVVSGGGFRSDLICEILADATGQTVVRQDAPEAGARGAAVLALVSAGRFDTVEEASEALRTSLETFEPDPAKYEAYKKSHEVFVKTRQALQPVWPAMRELRRNNGERSEA